MILKFVTVLFLTWTFSLSQTTVALSGMIQSSNGNQPIAGASILVKNLKLTAQSDANGNFSISNTSEIKTRLDKTVSPRAVNSNSIHFRHDAPGQVQIRILEMNGKEQSVLFHGKLSQGFWNVIPPSLKAGVYFCTFETPTSFEVVQFLGSSILSTPIQGSHLQSVSPSTYAEFERSKRSADAVVDTLWVSKTGYHTAVLPLTSYQQTGLTVSLTDSSSTSSEGATIVPDASWTCFMPTGIPPPKLGTVAFTLKFQIGAVHHVGLTKFGKRKQYDITGGTIVGTQINGTVLTGGLDYELELSNGSIEVEQIHILRANNIPILMRNAGVAPTGGDPVRVVLDFEAPNSSSFTWLNTGKFAATRIVDTIAKTITMEVYEISKAVLPIEKIQIKDPANVVHQTWECFTLTGGQGTTVFTENVTLGSSISIGASKRGSRNIIPITGGTTTGKVVGKILNGGADYQLGGLDARYTLAPNDGEFIIVRNCGANGLVPVFEARVEGPYNFLNENKYLSSAPGVGGGGVSITFYEKK